VSLEKELNAPEEVTWLDIPWKEWETVRPRLKEFTKLEMLSIRHASVDQFPASIYELSDLPHLFLDGGRIGQFPIGIAKGRARIEGKARLGIVREAAQLCCLSHIAARHELLIDAQKAAIAERIIETRERRQP